MEIFLLLAFGVAVALAAFFLKPWRTQSRVSSLESRASRQPPLSLSRFRVFWERYLDWRYSCGKPLESQISRSWMAEWLNGMLMLMRLALRIAIEMVNVTLWHSCDMDLDDLWWHWVTLQVQHFAEQEISSMFSKCALVDILWQDFLSVRSWRTGASTMESAGSGPLRSSARIQRGRGFWRINKCVAVWEDNWCYLMVLANISVSSL